MSEPQIQVRSYRSFHYPWISNYCRDRADGAIVAVNPKNNELLHYERATAYPPKKQVTIDLESIANRPVFQVHNDWIDCQIDICSVEVRMNYNVDGLYFRYLHYSRKILIIWTCVVILLTEF